MTGWPLHPSARSAVRLAATCSFVVLAVVASPWAMISLTPDAINAPACGASPQSPAPRVEPEPLSSAVAGLRVSAAERTALGELYGSAGVVPLWLARGTLTLNGREAMSLLRASARHGLDSTDYLVGPVAEPALGVPPSAGAQAAYDAALSVGVLRYMRHLHLGRVDPRAVGLRLSTWTEPHAFPAVLREAIAGCRVAATVEALAPPYVLYARLVEELARYRAVAARREPDMPPSVGIVKPGSPYAGAHALGVHLEARGDLAAADLPPPGHDRYDGTLVDGVRRFQARHGLTPDGVLGGRTIAAIRVPASARARQIEMALERLRWLPDLGNRRLIAVNIPMFHLWAWDTLDGVPAPAFSTRVIVGKAMRTETPVFVETLQHVVFRPYWNVPHSILRSEILPAMRRDPSYLTRQQMEVVADPGDDARPLSVGPATLEALAAGAVRVRQRPGPHNALGLVKFVFPNREGVYMHGTPAPSLFANDRRDFSHGCIRVADPPGLARWVLEGMGWDGERIRRAMDAGVSTRLDLAAPIDVVLFYLTAAVLPEDDAVHFADDIYGHDATLARALARMTSGEE